MNDRLKSVCDSRSLSAFVIGLRDETEVSDTTLDDYLEQMAAYLIDAGDGELRKYDSVSAEAWRLAADLLFSALVYE